MRKKQNQGRLKETEVRQSFKALWRALCHFHYAGKTKLRTFKKNPEVRQSFKVFVESIVSFPNAGRARKVSDGTGKVTVCRFKGVRGVRGKLYIIICIHSASRLSDPRSPCLIRQHKSDINSSLCASPICDKH